MGTEIRYQTLGKMSAVLKIKEKELFLLSSTEIIDWEKRQSTFKTGYMRLNNIKQEKNADYLPKGVFFR